MATTMFLRSIIPLLQLISACALYSTLVSGQWSGAGFTVSQYGMSSNDIGVTTTDGLQYLVNITLGGQGASSSVVRTFDLLTAML